jgi:dihydrolipoamide dehydrogenase
MTETRRFGAVVIGAGPGGYPAAIRLAQLGVDTAIIERGDVGGVCLNVGCIPSKALIEASKRFAFLDGAAKKMGISVEGKRVDVGQMQAWKGEVVHKLTSGVASLLESNGVTLLRGAARFDGPHRLLVEGEGGTTVVESEHIVIATGSRPAQIPGFDFDGEHVLSSTEALALPELPEHLVVIGGGYIGLEMGGVYARLGTKVTIVEWMDQLLPGAAKDLVLPVQKKLKAHGTEILLEAKAKGWEKADGGVVVTVETKDGKERRIEASKILVTVGRKPNSEGLGLEGIGVEIDRRGFVTTDDRLQTKIPGVYAIGDVAGEPMLAHKATKEGEVVAEVIAGKKVKWDVRAIPAVVFCDPEIATTGLSEAEAKAKGHDVQVGKFMFAVNGRALGTGEAEGFVRVIADAATDELLGVEIVGPDASDLIAEATLAIELGASSEDIGLTIHAHPTLAEATMEAANAARGEAIHAVNRKRKPR